MIDRLVAKIGLLIILICLASGCDRQGKGTTFKSGYSNGSLLFEVDDDVFVAMTALELNLIRSSNGQVSTKIKVGGPIVVRTYESIKGKDWISGLDSMKMGGSWKTSQGVIIPAGQIALLDADGKVKEVGHFNLNEEMMTQGEWEADVCGKALLGKIFSKEGEAYAAIRAESQRK